MDLTDLGVCGLPFTVTRRATGLRLERPQPEGSPLVVTLQPLGGRLTGTFAGLGFTAPLAATRTTRTPRALREEEMRFRNGDVELAATLLLPAGAGPFPGIVVTHSSGPGERSYGAYRSQGVFYARQGLAALLYDRRGSGASSGDAAAASLEDLADDALAAVRALRADRRVVASRVGVAGTSQGGWIAPLAAMRSPEVAFVITISASAISPAEQSIFHVENGLRAAGYPADVVEQATSLRRRLYAGTASGHPDATLAADLAKAHQQPWFASSSLPYPLPERVSPGERQFLLFAPLPTWEALRVPVLALWGGRDIQVPAEQSRDLVEAALRRGGNHDHTLVLYPRADHFLRLVREPAEPWDFPREPAGMRLLLAEWLRERLRS